MNVKVPSNVRAALYVVSVFLNTFTAALVAGGVKLNIWVVAGLAGFNAVVALMARANVSPNEE